MTVQPPTSSRLGPAPWDRARRAPSHRSHGPGGYTLLETLTVLAVIGTIAAVAVGPMTRMRARAQVAAARDAFAATHALARQVAAQYGAISRLHIDTAGRRFWITVEPDGPEPRLGTATVRPIVDVGRFFAGVDVDSNRGLLCFGPRGLGAAYDDCELPNATLVFSKSGIVDSATISRLGRLRLR